MVDIIRNFLKFISIPPLLIFQILYNNMRFLYKKSKKINQKKGFCKFVGYIIYVGVWYYGKYGIE